MINLEILKKSQIGFTIGIRFRNNFIIEDNYGAIIDSILYDKNSFFTPRKFPVVLSNENEKILWNENTKNRLIINPANIILDVADQKDISEENSIKIYGEHIVKEILSEYKVENVNRIGYVHKYFITDKEFREEFRKRVIPSKGKTLSNLNLQFTQKIPMLPEAKTHKNVSDYYNVIYTFMDMVNDDRGLFLSVDFQRLFVPTLETIRGLDYNQFISKTQSYENNVVTFLTNNYGKINE